jgi:hypothetical protein
VLHDLRYALRLIGKDRWFPAAAIGCIPAQRCQPEDGSDP